MEHTNTVASNATEAHATNTIEKRYTGVLVKREHKTRADVWEHMTKIKFDKHEKAKKARCNYCQ